MKKGAPGNQPHIYQVGRGSARGDVIPKKGSKGGGGQPPHGGSDSRAQFQEGTHILLRGLEIWALERASLPDQGQSEGDRQCPTAQSCCED